MVLPQRTGYGVVLFQMLPSVGGNMKEALNKASEFWASLTKEEKARRNKVAQEIWMNYQKNEEAKKKAAAEKQEKSKMSP